MTDNKQHSIQTRHLSIGYSPDNKILEELNLTANAGNLIALIGVNGTGKSTLLKTMLNLQKPIEGKVILDNKYLNEYSISDLAKKISWVSTEIVSVQNLSVFNLVSLGRFPYTNWLGKLTSKDKEIVYRSLDQVGIKHISNKNIHEISDGERQRTLIARTLAQDTPIILLDEPTSFLDLPNKFEIIHLLHHLSSENQKTIVFSTHDLNIALQEADIFWIIHNKKIITGCPEDLILNGDFTRLLDNSNLNFNYDDGSFTIKHTVKQYVHLHGEGKTHFWTLKALQRSGYALSRKENEKAQNIYIMEQNGKVRWKLVVNKKSYELRSIRELLNVLNSLH